MLNEGFSEVVYHFTTMKALKNIMSTNEIKFSKAENSTDKSIQSDKYSYFLSITRQSSPNVGYPNIQNNKVGGKPRTPEFSYDGVKRYRLTDTNNGKKYTHVYTDNNGVKWGVNDTNNISNRNTIRDYSETEERILSKTPIFKNVYDYITRIDILTGENNLKVRIAFDGKKLESTFKGCIVDYYNGKYLKGLESTAKKTPQGTTRGRKKLSRVNEAKRTNYLMTKEWDILNHFLSAVKISIPKDKGRMAIITLEWFKKIFVQTNNGIRHLGVNVLTNRQKDIKGLYSYEEWGDLARKFSKNKIQDDGIPVLRKSDVNVILGVIFLLTPHNVDISEKINAGLNMCHHYFNDVMVKVDKSTYNLGVLLENNLSSYFNSRFKELKMAKTDKRKKDIINLLMKGAKESKKKQLTPYAPNIYEILKNMFDDFDATHEDIDCGYETYVYNKFYRNPNAPKDNRGRTPKKQTFEDEDMIMEMSLKVLELLKEKDK